MSLMSYVLLNSTGRHSINDILSQFPGDLWYFPAGYPHSIQALGEEDTPIAANGTEFLLIFDSGEFSIDGTFLLTDWLAHVPKGVLAKNFGQPQSAFAKIPGRELYIFPGIVYPIVLSSCVGRVTDDL